MRKMRFGPLLAVMVLGLAGAAVAQTDGQGMTEEELYAAAKGEGEVTWYVAHFDATTAQKAADAFEDKYPGIEVNVTRATAQVIYQRLMQGISNQTNVVDVFSSTDIGQYIRLRDEGHLAHFVPPDSDKMAEAFKDPETAGYYYTTTAGMVLITYNTDQVSAEEAPKNWTDLVDPKWKSRVSVGHPAFSGYVGTWVVTMNQLYGWEYFEKLEKNDPQIGRSVNDTVTMLNAGEAAVAAGPEGTTLESASGGNPLGIVYPTDGALLMITPSAVMADSPHPNAARLFMNFLFSPEYAEVLVGHFVRPTITGVDLAPGMKPLSEIKTVRPTAQEILTDIPKVIEKWRDTFLQ